ncbi:hypothetical protein HDU83_007198 [Entophlyctis luteolus]|nr:hypothetical protein HDU83_007198 [Entophlyctis luteolus]KAJ3378941.1 hypothetical protein HDU84_007163 [Entophlyctis sp. JEL0112]
MRPQPSADSKKPSCTDELGSILRFLHVGKSISVQQDGAPKYSITRLGKPAGGPFDNTKGILNMKELKLQYTVYNGAIKSFTIASEVDNSAATCEFIPDHEHYSEPKQHQKFRFSLSMPSMEFVSHDLSMWDSSADARHIKCAFDLPNDGRRLRWFSGDDTNRHKLEIWNEVESLRWTSIAEAVVDRQAFFESKPKLFAFGSSSKSADKPEFGLLSLCSRDVFDWSAQSDEFVRLVVATLWTVWCNDNLNPDGELAEILKRRNIVRHQSEQARFSRSVGVGAIGGATASIL